MSVLSTASLPDPTLLTHRHSNFVVAMYLDFREKMLLVLAAPHYLHYNERSSPQQHSGTVSYIDSQKHGKRKKKSHTDKWVLQRNLLKSLTRTKSFLRQN